MKAPEQAPELCFTTKEGSRTGSRFATKAPDVLLLGSFFD